MKKFNFLLAMFFCLFCFGQRFKLTPNGFVDKDAPSKNYIVLKFAGKTQADLYKKVMVIIDKTYNSLHTTITHVEPETITIHSISEGKIRRTRINSSVNLYTITLHFKDGKIKIDAPLFELTSIAYSGQEQQMFLKGNFTFYKNAFGIYTEKGEVRYEKAEEDLNNFANNFVADIKNSIEQNDEW